MSTHIKNSNADFAAFLKQSLEAKKLREAGLTNDFISKHYATGALAQVPEKPTEEIIQYAKAFKEKKMWAEDAHFKEIVIEIANNFAQQETVQAEQKVEVAKAEAVRSSGYRGEH